MDTLFNLGDMVVDGVLTRFRGLSREDLTAEQVARYEAKVDRTGGGDTCHEWTAGRFTGGYGAFGVGNRLVKAHRVAYVLAYGFVPAGLVVRHRCDNPPCCNPRHLTLGTNQDNSQDMIDRARQLKGEGHGMAKLTIDIVNECRRQVRQGAKYPDLARKYGVVQSGIRYAVTGVTWPDADEPPVTEPRVVRHEWTPDEDAVVFDGSVAEVAARLGRSVASVACRRKRLRHPSGKAPQRRWTEAEDAVVFDGTRAEVAARLGCTVSSVANRRHTLRARQGVTEQ